MTPVTISILGYQEPLFQRLTPIFDYLPADVAQDAAVTLEDIFRRMKTAENTVEEELKRLTSELEQTHRQIDYYWDDFDLLKEKLSDAHKEIRRLETLIGKGVDMLTAAVE